MAGVGELCVPVKILLGAGCSPTRGRPGLFVSDYPLFVGRLMSVFDWSWLEAA